MNGIKKSIKTINPFIEGLNTNKGDKIMEKINYIANGARWFDKINGNTYHSVRVTRVSDGKTIAAPFQYGYGDHYRQTALEIMLANNWLPETYNRNNIFIFERENDYPIYWTVSDGLKRDCIANGII